MKLIKQNRLFYLIALKLNYFLQFKRWMEYLLTNPFVCAPIQLSKQNFQIWFKYNFYIVYFCQIIFVNKNNFTRYADEALNQVERSLIYICVYYKPQIIAFKAAEYLAMQLKKMVNTPKALIKLIIVFNEESTVSFYIYNQRIFTEKSSYVVKNLLF